MRKFLLLIIAIPIYLNSQNSYKVETVSTRNSLSEMVSKKTISNINLGRKILNPAKSTDSTPIDTTYFDSFEYFNGETLIPNNWSTKHKTESTYYWHATEAISILETIAPTDGNYMMWINFDQELLEQDTWLISPEIQPKDGDLLEFDLYYAPVFMYYKYNEETGDFYFDFSSPTATLKVMIAEAGSDNWTELWDAHNLAEMYNEENILEYMGAWDWYKISLQPYVGKTIKLAFQYVGQNGDSMALDRILIGKEKSSNGMEKYEYTKDFNIKCTGNSFEIQAPKEFKTISVKNLQGVTLGMYNLNSEGTTYISTSGLTDKIYIFNFKSNNKNISLKVLKK